MPDFCSAAFSLTIRAWLDDGAGRFSATGRVVGRVTVSCDFDRGRRKAMFYHPKMLSGMNPNNRIADAKERFSNGPQPLTDARADCGRARHKTLVPVDGSEYADRAIEYVDSLAQRGLTTEIHLLNVQPSVLRGDAAFDDLVQAEETARLAAAQQIMQRALARLQGGVPVKVAVRFGRAANAIAGYANEQGITAIAMATRTRRSLRSLFRRSVAMDVVRRVNVPVTLLKPIVAGDAREFGG